MQQSKLHLSWDEDEPDRVKTLKRKFNADQVGVFFNLNLLQILFLPLFFYLSDPYKLLFTSKFIFLTAFCFIPLVPQLGYKLT